MRQDGGAAGGSEGAEPSGVAGRCSSVRSHVSVLIIQLSIIRAGV